jgi:hypothetical protein
MEKIAMKMMGCVLNMGAQNEIRSQIGAQTDMRSDLTRVANLLRLFSDHAEFRTAEDVATCQCTGRKKIRCPQQGEKMNLVS